MWICPVDWGDIEEKVKKYSSILIHSMRVRKRKAKVRDFRSRFEITSPLVDSKTQKSMSGIRTHPHPQTEIATAEQQVAASSQVRVTVRVRG